MKIIIDLETIEPGKQDWLLDTLSYGHIPFTEAEPGWTDEEIKEHNHLIDTALQDQSMSMEDAKKIILQW